MAKPQDGGEFKTVLDTWTDGTNERPLEMVDLDGDTQLELVTVVDFKAAGSTGRGRVLARVWKWSRAKFKYDLVRTTGYADRLRPIRR